MYVNQISIAPLPECQIIASFPLYLFHVPWFTPRIGDHSRQTVGTERLRNSRQKTITVHLPYKLLIRNGFLSIEMDPLWVRVPLDWIRIHNKHRYGLSSIMHFLYNHHHHHHCCLHFWQFHTPVAQNNRSAYIPGQHLFTVRRELPRFARSKRRFFSNVKWTQVCPGLNMTRWLVRPFASQDHEIKTVETGVHFTARTHKEAYISRNWPCK